MQVLYQLSYAPRVRRLGDEETRTPDILLAKQALYQLSYIPACRPPFSAPLETALACGAIIKRGDLK
jgi:hypothetical protein